jgi:hypothetical protein
MESVVHRCHHPERIRQEQLARFSKRYPFPQLFEQLRAEVSLQLPNTHRNARLAEVNFLAGAREVQVLSHTKKNL